MHGVWSWKCPRKKKLEEVRARKRARESKREQERAKESERERVRASESERSSDARAEEGWQGSKNEKKRRSREENDTFDLIVCTRSEKNTLD